MPTHYQESKYPRRTRCPHMSSVTYLKKQAAVSRGHFAFNCCKAWVKNKELGRNGLDLLKRVDREGRVVPSLVQAGSDRVSALWQLPPRTQAFTNTVEVRVLQEKRAGLLPSPARQSASWDPAHKARQEHTGLASRHWWRAGAQVWTRPQNISKEHWSFWWHTPLRKPPRCPQCFSLWKHTNDAQWTITNA